MYECLICLKEVCEDEMDICDECYPAFKEDMDESNKEVE